jgi:thioredoxin 1
MPEHLDSEGLSDAKNSDDVWVVDFFADWCGPCQKLKPIYQDVSEEFDDVNFGKVDMEENSSAATSEGVSALPTLVMYKNGEEVARSTGFMSENKLQEWVSSNV